MKNKLILLSLLGLTMAQAQIGINTDKPKATLDVKYTNGTSAQGVLFPTMTKEQRDAMVAPPQGLTIFNSSVPCLQANLGTPDKPEWHCVGSTGDSSGVVSTSGSGDNSGGGTGNGGNTGATPITVPPTVKIKKGERLFASIYDEDYLPYTKPGGAASFGVVAADGNNESKIIDYQGIIPTGGVAVYVPVEVSGGQVTLPAYTSGDLEITADKTQDGQARNLVLSWESQTLTSQSKIIKATLKSKNGDLLIKKLDINGGVGNDSKGILLGRFTLPQADGATAEQYEVRVIGGIPDKNFEIMTNGQYEHRFLYLPITGPDGRVWLNNNLGADYANLESTHYSPIQQAQGNTDNDIKADFHAHGSLFQWGHIADGHELVDWTDKTNGIPRHAELRQNSRRLAREWSSDIEPCPSGFHTPTLDEIRTLFEVVIGPAYETEKLWSERTLRLTAAGKLNTGAERTTDTSSLGEYWSQNKGYVSSGQHLLFGRDGADTEYGNSSQGRSIRCIQDLP